MDEVALLLAQRGVSHAPSPFLDDVIRLKGPSGGLENELAAGLFYPMDEGSAAIASLVPVRGKTVVDLAAAPGGKSVVLRLHGGCVVSCDVSLSRLQTLRRTSGRMFDVSTPTAPGSACTNGRRLASWSWGAWSEAIASMVPSANPATIALRSASERSGGDSLANVRQLPTADSLSPK